jgi:hydrogenase nickel incorporation protein HypA/HybF
MHEIALCRAVLELIEEQQRRDPFARVHRVVLEIGALGHVDPRALTFAFEAASAGTVAATAILDIRELPARAWCADCGETVTIPARGSDCPHCGGRHLALEQGDELRLRALEVA